MSCPQPKGRTAKAEMTCYEEPYRAFWRSLTPAERLRRAWGLRKRIPDLQKLHDEKLIPRL